MRWPDSINEPTALRLEALKETVQDRRKIARSGGRKYSE
jgi:hypothetical protein